MTDNIYHLKLINGEEIITRIDIKSLAEDDLLLIHPMVVDVVQTDEGAETILANYIKYTTNPKCKISKSKIITFNKVPDEIKVYYVNSKHFADSHDEKFLKEIRNANKLMTDHIESEKEGPPEEPEDFEGTTNEVPKTFH